MKKITFVCASLLALAASAEVPYKIGIAGFTFCKCNFDKALEIMKEIDCRYLCHKDFFLGYNANDAQIKEYKDKLEKAGIVSVATGPNYHSTEAEIKALFEFARRYGMKTVVAVPFETAEIGGKKERVESDKVLDIAERYVKEYDIKYAIHNHGPDIPYLYPTAESVMKRLANRDPRMGLCLDVGHQKRGGMDPIAAIRKYSDRIFDVHLKNIKLGASGKGNLSMPGPRGELDILGIMTALAETGYDGVCHIEYEKDFENNRMALAESMGYYRGIADAIKVPPKMEKAPEGANTLSAAEKADGWQLLWNGKDGEGWVGVANGCKRFPEKGWVMKDGTLTMMPVKGIAPDGTWFPLPPEDQKLGGGGDIVTVKKYKDFMFKFDFRLTRAANSGVKYFFDENQNRGTCEEYQVLDDAHPDSTKGKNGNRRIAALYDIFPANGTDSLVKRLGKWNTGMIVAKGATVEHWLNGVKVLSYNRDSAEFAAAVKASKYASWGKSKTGENQPWGLVKEGRILLQDHSDSTVSYCNIKIKEL